MAFALASAASLYVPRRWRGRLFAGAAVVGLARIFVGAHLPLDVVGGAGLGWATAAVVRLCIGAASGRPSIDAVRAGLARIGLGVEDVQPLAVSATTSAVYRVQGPAGTLFAKVVGDRPQDRDVIYRLFLSLRRSRPRGEQRFASPELQVEHEAARTLMAAATGARVPHVVFAGPLNAELAVLVTTWVPGQPASERDVWDQAVSTDARRQLALLHRGGVVHGDLDAANILVDGSEVTFVDFGDAVLLPDDSGRARDLAALQRSLPDVAASC